MNIPQTLPQFLDTPTLFIVTGDRAGEFYVALDGVMERTHVFKVDKPHYSDRENFGRRGSMVFEAGSKVDAQKKTYHVEFLKKFTTELNAATKAQTFKKVYLFAPADVLKELKKIVTSKKLTVTKAIAGNFQKESFAKLIGRLKK